MGAAAARTLHAPPPIEEPTLGEDPEPGAGAEAREQPERLRLGHGSGAACGCYEPRRYRRRVHPGNAKCSATVLSASPATG